MNTDCYKETKKQRLSLKTDNNIEISREKKLRVKVIWPDVAIINLEKWPNLVIPINSLLAVQCTLQLACSLIPGPPGN